ncbi:MAG TPA: hypothetical protein DIW81_20305 [Planctomycetaceae bacterium]|nr:hypothetical protein [Rubinisphaera sp.]HCS53897.1 hypothetical protein [Planctomycetaceae bacterium]
MGGRAASPLQGFVLGVKSLKRTLLSCFPVFSTRNLYRDALQGMHHYLYRTSQYAGLRKFNDFFDFSEFPIFSSHLDIAILIWVLYWK